MPQSFFGKINLLVRSQLNDLLNFGDGDEESRREVLSRREVGESLGNDVTALRKRVNDAVAYEQQLQQQVDALYQEIADLDARADAAVDAGRDQEARRHIARLQQAQRELTMKEADLREHRSITGELISQVNRLEAYVEQGKRQTEQQAQNPPPTDADEAERSGNRIEELTRSLTERLDSTRKALSDLVNNQGQEPMPEVDRDQVTGRGQQPEQTTTPGAGLLRDDDVIVEEVPPPPRRPITNSREVDDDLARRLSRLSKPDDDKRD